jgi:DNA polymerase-3 subunit alpha
MAARNAVRDVARVLQVPYSEADRLAKMIPPPVQGRHIPLKKSLEDNAELRDENDHNPTAARVFELAVKMEGTIRSHGVHAAGVVIAPDEIVKFAPLEMAQKGVVATQYSMNPIEELGLLKMDFLGLSNLTIIKNALRIIKKVHGEDIDINKIPLDDVATFGLLQRGDTTGVFQLESAGMKRYLKDLRPSVFEDIVAMVALYRPGPMQFIEDFVARKHGEREITYFHPKMENALKNTYGVLVYQEQVMQISKDLCGFTGGQADTLRKGIAKKIPEVLAKMKVQFIEGAVTQSGADKNEMEKFWKQLEDFAAYCFNKSHAACYGLIAYQTAYLKAHYPSAFMAALMTSDYDDTDRLAIEITECKHMGIDVMPPDVSESFVEFAVVPKTGQIRFGMNAIKNVGTGAVEEILRARKIDGGFTSLEDFFQKVNPRVVNRKALESLLKAGAFDRFGERVLLLNNIDGLLAFANKVQKEVASGQTDLFGNTVDASAHIMPKIVLETNGPVIGQREQLQWERDLLGLYLSQHPLQAFETLLSEQVMPLKDLREEYDGKMVVVGGAVVESREITTKNGQKMAFTKIADMGGEIELVLFPSVFQQTIGIWNRDNVIIAKGKLSAKDKEGVSTGSLKVLADEAREVTIEQAQAYQSTGKSVKSPSSKKTAATKVATPSSTASNAPTPVPERLYLRLESSADQKLLIDIKGFIDSYPGKVEVVLVIGAGTGKQIVKLPVLVEPSDECVGKLRGLLGQDSVRLQ